MAKGMTFEELQAYAQAHYNRGGDSVVECWGKREYDEYVEICGPITKRKALAMFRDNYEVSREIMATAW